MVNLSNRYGHTRPAAIAARLASLRAQFAPVAIEVPAPVLTLVPATPKPKRTGAAQIAQWQAERAEIRADLPMLRLAAREAVYHGDGPTFAEIAALERRLETLDDYLIFEEDAPALPMLLAA